jgi:hypothetical protein
VYDSARTELDILDGKEVNDVFMTAKKPSSSECTI